MLSDLTFAKVPYPVKYLRIFLFIISSLTFPMLRQLCPKHKDAKIFEKHLNPVILVFMG